MGSKAGAVAPLNQYSKASGTLKSHISDLWPPWSTLGHIYFTNCIIHLSKTLLEFDLPTMHLASWTPNKPTLFSSAEDLPNSPQIFQHFFALYSVAFLAQHRDTLENLVKKQLKAAWGLGWRFYENNCFCLFRKVTNLLTHLTKHILPYTIKKTQIHNLLPKQFPNQDRKAVCQWDFKLHGSPCEHHDNVRRFPSNATETCLAGPELPEEESSTFFLYQGD